MTKQQVIAILGEPINRSTDMTVFADDHADGDTIPHAVTLVTYT
jgi:hypothetical protein